MNTPTHAALNFLVLGRTPQRGRIWIVLGAVLPDVPMFTFFLYEAYIRGEPVPRIFGETYFEPRWQMLFDAFHSIPIFAVAGAWFLWRRNRPGQLFVASLLLHSLVDWPTHLEDAHAYFWPIWRRPLRGFVSYWHPGSKFWLFELFICGSAVAWIVGEKALSRERSTVLRSRDAAELVSAGGRSGGRGAGVRAARARRGFAPLRRLSR
jgi:hypothetical protein